MKKLNFTTVILAGVGLLATIFVINYLFFSPEATQQQRPGVVTPQPNATPDKGELTVQQTPVAYDFEDSPSQGTNGQDIFVVEVLEDSENPLTRAQLESLKVYFARERGVSTNQIQIKIATKYYALEDGVELEVIAGDGEESKGVQPLQTFKIPLRELLRVSELNGDGYLAVLTARNRVQVTLKGTYTQEEFEQQVLKAFPDWREYEISYSRSSL